MSQIVPISKNSLPAIIGREIGTTFPQPFIQEIYLDDFYVAGCYHIEEINLYLADLVVEHRLTLQREPKNSHDPNAIIVLDPQNRKLGYLPQKINLYPSRLMDAGKLLYGKVTAINDKHPRITAKLYMRG